VTDKTDPGGAIAASSENNVKIFILLERKLRSWRIKYLCADQPCHLARLLIRPSAACTDVTKACQLSSQMFRNDRSPFSLPVAGPTRYEP
jgi:hypothetical protein